MSAISALNLQDAGIMTGGDDADWHAGEQLSDDAAMAQGVYRHLGRILTARTRHSRERLAVAGSLPLRAGRLVEQWRVCRPIRRRQPCREIGRDRNRIMRYLL